MKSHLPKSVMIGGVRVAIQVFPLESCYGAYNHAALTIAIDSDTASDVPLANETLRHEMMHAALRISGVAYSDRMEEEAVVRCMEQIFFPAWEAVLPQIT